MCPLVLNYFHVLFFAYQCFRHWFSWVFFGFSVVFMFFLRCVLNFFVFQRFLWCCFDLFYRPFMFLRFIYGFQYGFLTFPGLSLVLSRFLILFHWF